jgi:GR25 family glycosyltransferase involved in LPS biosynthesis
VKFNDYFPNPILINLNRRTDRLEQFDKQAKALGIQYERLQAIESVDPRLGCKLSHLAALTKYASEVIFIFEDDAVFVDDFEKQFEQAMAWVPEDWHMLYFGAHMLQKQRVNDYWYRSLECSSTHAYAVKRQFVHKLIKAGMNPTNHIDVDYASLHKDVIAYVARPTLIYQGPGYSDLLGSEVDYKDLYF